MKIFLVICLVAASLAAEDVLRGILRSPKMTLELYGDFKSQEHLKFLASEDRMRFRLFRSNAQLVAQANEEGGSAIFGLNFFSALTEDEKQQYLGLNVTGHDENPMHVASSLSSPPEKKLWTNEGKVTAVKNQGSCGSCWTFGAVGGLETRYHGVSGKLRNFAEQEYLDCVYEGQRNGCNGGWPDNCYEYSKKNGGRLASTADYAYAGKDGSCKGSSKPDAMVAAKIVGYTSVSPTEAANIQALASGSLSVAFEVTSYFQQYRGGIIKDTTCTGRPNHAVTAVGYTSNFVLVKNSWGSKWGESGFVKFARGYPSNCGLFKYSSYPNLDTTGQSDNTPSDKATDYKPSENDDVTPNPKPDPNCTDKATNCHLDWCTWENWKDTVKEYCQKTCKFCGDDGDDGECASGTIRCDDGVCRHEHMC
ncbi:uncharacterized protein LOC134825807 [Bolinopsis microptera]|uniref:uncharacterized protein LOC134825807 n=1 Tax=Bolinopsis microptera TaxID=2820187 RepID=UPI0030793172